MSLYLLPLSITSKDFFFCSWLLITVLTVDVFTFHYIQFPSSCLPFPPGGVQGFPVPLKERDSILGEQGNCFCFFFLDY